MDTAKRISAVRDRLRELQTDEQLAERAGPGCETCIHFIAPHCTHLANVDRAFNPVRGQFDERPKTLATEARAVEGLCGPEALLHERGLAGAVVVRGPGVWRAAVNVFALGGLVAAIDAIHRLL